MIEHVYQRVRRVDRLDEVVVLTDDERIQQVVEGFGGRCELTPAACRSGTDRVAWAARGWNAGAILDVQGDEPLVDTDDLAVVVRHLERCPEDPVVTLATECPPDLVDDPNAVKVVVDRSGYALYFSRAAIPHRRGEGGFRPLLHVGVYGYQRQALLDLAELDPTPLEQSESLEQLRALENGLRIRVLEASRPSLGVDTEEDLARVEKLISEREGSAGKVPVGSQGTGAGR